MKLWLCNNAIGDAGAMALAGSPHLRNLAFLDLSCNQIGEQGALALAASPHLEGLSRLELGENDLGSKGEGALKERFADRVLCDYE